MAQLVFCVCVCHCRVYVKKTRFFLIFRGPALSSALTSYNRLSAVLTQRLQRMQFINELQILFLWTMYNA